MTNNYSNNVGYGSLLQAIPTWDKEDPASMQNQKSWKLMFSFLG